MSDGGQFVFETNVEDIRQRIVANLNDVVREVDAAEGRIGRGSNSSSDFFTGLNDRLAIEGAALVQNINKVGREAQAAMDKGLTPPDMGKALSEFAAKYKAGVEAAMREVANVPKDSATFPFQSLASSATAQAETEARKVMQVWQQALNGTGAAFKMPGSSLSSIGDFGDTKKLTDLLNKELPEGVRASVRALQTLMDQINKSETTGRYSPISAAQETSLRLAAQGKGKLAGSADFTGDPKGRFQFVDPTSGRLLELQGRQLIDVGDRTLRAAKEVERQTAERAKAEAQIAAQENTARAQRVITSIYNKDPGVLPVGKTGYAYSNPDNGFVRTSGPNTGAMVDEEKEIGTVARLTELLSAQLHKLAQDEFEATQNAKTLSDEFIKGVFGAGGRKYRGGAQEIDEGNPLAGLAETAGVVAKYEVLGRSMQAVADFAGEGVSQFAELDHAVAEYNSVVGESGTATQKYISDLENLSTVAGISVTDAMEAATRGVAAFSSESDSRDKREQVGRDFTKSVAQYSLITNQTPQASANDLIAAGSSYGMGADQVDQISNAVAHAREHFGADAGAVGQGIQLLADVGKEAGFSLNELAQVIGLVQARTGESGTAIAGNLQRIFAEFQGSSGQNALRAAGVDASGTVKQQIEALAKVFPTLTEKQRQSVEASLGGARALRDLIPLLDDNTKLQEAYEKSLTDGGAASREAQSEIHSLAGQFKEFNTLIKTIASDAARTGVLTPLIIGLETLKPLLSILDHALQLFSDLFGQLGKFTGHEGFATGAKDAIVTVGELALAWNLVSDAQKKAIAGTFNGGLSGLMARVMPGRAKPIAPEADFSDGLGPAGRQAQAFDNLRNVQMTGAATVAAAEADLATATKNFTAGSAEIIAAEQAVAAARAEAETAKTAATDAVTEATGVYTKFLQAQTSATEEDAAVTEEHTLTVGESISALGEFIVALGRASFAAIRSAPGAIAASAPGGFIKKAFTTSLGDMGLMPTLLGVAGVGASIYEMSKHQRELVGAYGKSDNARDAFGAAGASGTPDDLKKAATDLSSAANAIHEASSGFFGTIAGGLTEVFGGPNRGAEARYDSNMAKVAAEQAKKLEEDRAELNKGGHFDFTAPNGVKDGLDAMTKSGASATEMLRALNESLDDLLKVKAGKRQIATGSGKVFADEFGGNLADNASVGANYAAHKPGYSFWDNVKHDWFRSNDTPSNKAGKELMKLDWGKVGDGLTEEMSSYLSANGLADGGTVSNDQVHAMEDLAVEGLKTQLKKQGKDWASLPKELQDSLAKNAIGTVAELVNKLKHPDQNITKENVEQYMTSAIQMAGQAGSEKTNSNYLSGGVKGDGGEAVAGAKARLDAIKEAIARVKAANTGEDMTGMYVEEDAAKVALEQARLAHVKANFDLSGSKVSQYDKDGQLKNSIDAIKSQLDKTKSKDTRKTLNAELNQLMQQADAQTLADATSLISSKVDQHSPLQQAQAALDIAKKNLNTLKAQGATGQALTDAQTGVNQASAANDSAVHSDANELLLAKVGIGDAVGEAWAEYYNALNDAHLAVDPGAKAKMLKAAKQYKEQAHMAALDLRNAQALAKIDPRDVLANDRQQLDYLQGKFNKTPTTDKKGRADLQRQIAEQKLKVQQDKIAVADATALSKVDANNTVGQAQVALQNAERDLNGMKKGQADYIQKQTEIKKLKQDVAKAERDIAEKARDASVFTGSELGGAQAAFANATTELKIAKKTDGDYWDKVKAYNDAKVQLAYAISNNKMVIEELSIDFTDPIKEAQLAVDKATRKLKDDLANGADKATLDQDKLDLQKAQASAEKTAFEQNLSDARTNYELGRTSFAAYLSYLQSQHDYLSAIKNRTYDQQQELNEVDQALKDANAGMQGQFNLGDIKLPTVYQARRHALENGIDITDVSGDSFGAGGDLAPIKTKFITPLNKALDGLQTDAAVARLNSLAQAIGVLAGTAAGSTSVQDLATAAIRRQMTPIGAVGNASTTVYVNGADFGKVVAYLEQALGQSAQVTRTYNGRKI